MILHKLILMISFSICLTTHTVAQITTPLPDLHVDGRNIVDQHGDKVVLHGVMDTPNPYFNGYRWGYQANDDNINSCISYFDKLFSGLTDSSQGAYCNVFRLHLDPCWTNDPNKQQIGASGEQNISQFSAERLKKYMDLLYWPLMKKAMDHGLYVVVRPPGVCPGSIQVGDDYYNYLMTVWGIVSQNSDIQKYAGQISLELANEPVTVKDANGNNVPNALHDFFQPIVNKIRQNGFKGIIWIPGSSWQGNYTGYTTYPIKDTNFGYAVHNYPGWYDTSDEKYDPSNCIRQFKNLVPVVESNPIIITEVDWSPQVANYSPDDPKTYHLNEHGDKIPNNYGTWATATTSKWGNTYKKMMDYYGNISMTLSGTGCYLDIDTLLEKDKVVPAFKGITEACGETCMQWYRDYAKRNKPYPDNYVFSVEENKLDSIVWQAGDQTMLVASAVSFPICYYYTDGRAKEITSAIKYNVNTPGIVNIDNGLIKTVGDGTANITASYTDESGKYFYKEFKIYSSFFLFNSKFIDCNLFSNGTYDEQSRTFHPGQWGQMGWHFNYGADFSKYHYLVLKLKQPQNCSGMLMLFPQNSIQGDSYNVAMENNTTLPVDLTTATTTEGKKLNEVPIYIVSLWSNGSGDIDVSDMYLTNNTDYSPSTDIVNIKKGLSLHTDYTDVYNIFGIRVRNHVSLNSPTDGLPKGIYIINGKKLSVR